MKNKQKIEKLALTITTTYWATKGNVLQYEAKAKDVFGNKYTFTVDSKEQPPVRLQKNIVSPAEWNRIKLEMDHKYKTKYKEVLKAFNKAYLDKQKIEKAL